MKTSNHTKAELKKVLLIENVFNMFGDTGAFVPLLLACDISKTSDRVWLAGLLHKFKCCGFLKKFSQKGPVNPGVPQGSFLSPTLSLVYINDLPDDIIL